jgi:hypothetical protein
MTKRLTTGKFIAWGGLLSAAAVAVLCAGCSKKEDAAAQQNQNPVGGSITVNQGPGGVTAKPDESGVTRYSDEGPELGTSLTRRVTIVRKAADQGAEILSRLGPSTAVNKKARHSAYYLVDYPTGQPGEMKPGWILQEDINQPVAPVVTAHPTTVATVAPVATTAAPVGGRPPPIRIKR